MSKKKQLWNHFIEQVKKNEAFRLVKHEVKELIWSAPFICETDPETVKVMVVTEQAVHEEEVLKKYQKMGCKAHFDSKKQSTPMSVNAFLGDDMFKDSVEGQGPIYWTHAVKYPIKANDKRKKVVRFFTNWEVINRDLSKNGNAWFLKREIEILNPKIIVTFGRSGTELLLPILGLDNMAHKRLWEIVKKELEIYMKSKSLGFTWNGNRFIALYHPSGANASGMAVNEFFKGDLRKLIREEIHG